MSSRSNRRGAIRSRPCPVAAETDNAGKRNALGVRELIALVGQQQRRQADPEGIVGLRLRVVDPFGRERLEQRHAFLLEPSPQAGDLIDASGVPEVDDEQGAAGVLERAWHPGLEELGAHRRQVEKLEVDVLVGEHPGQRDLRGERVGSGGGVRAGQPRMKARLAGVGWTQQRDLRCAFRPHDQRGSAARPTLARPGDVLRQLLDPRLEVGLDVLGALVLGDRAQHLAQAFEPFLRLTRLAIGLLGRLVLRREVGRHGPCYCAPTSEAADACARSS
jgi:hypothetical protein